MSDGGGSYANAAVSAANLAASIYFGNKNLEITEDQYQLQKSSYELDRQNTYLNTLSTVYQFDKDIEALKGDKAQAEIDIRDTKTQIDSYQKWLDNYNDMYDAETTSAQAQIKELESSGKQAYEGLMEAIGYNDALAGATGRVGTNTSTAKIGSFAKEQLTDYVGTDLTLDANGGLYGLQKSAADKNYGQLLVDLDFQKQEKEVQKTILGESLATLSASQDTISQSITDAETRKGELQAWVDENFGDVKGSYQSGQKIEIEDKEYKKYTG
jgi:hypothetical protein